MSRASRATLAILAALPPVLAGCDAGASRLSEVDRFLQGYATEYQRRYYADAEAQWANNTRIVAGDTTNAARARQTGQALAAFVGSVANIDTIRAFLADSARLTPLQQRQLEVMLYNAASSPQTVADTVRARIAAETEQVEKLYGYQFRIGGKAVTANDVDRILRESRNPAERLAAWEASKAVGPTLKPGMIRLRGLRNQVVQALGYSDFFTYQVSDYGMTTPEMLALSDSLIAQVMPLYREIHTWARHELARRYGVPVPDHIPAHWLPNRWGQDWTALVEVEGINADSAIGTHDAQWVVKQGENFYVSLGFDTLPASFYEKSSLFPLPADAPYKKNTHASAWHLDLDQDVRSLMSVEPNQEWYGTTHHELGHVYYFQSYSRPEVPLVLRNGANRAYHEAIGSLMGLAALQPRFLAGRGLAAAGAKPDSTKLMLQEALDFIVFMPWSAGTMTRFEHAIYAENLPPEQWNEKWWALARQYQGIVPPPRRGDDYADELTKTHINDDPGQYYDYAIANALLFQMHDHIARNILKQDPHDTDYYGNRGVGDFLRTLMSPGASRPWRDVLRETTGRELDARAMVDYFQPLYEWLKRQNQGRRHTI
ncbi:MAG TPA: M2 family metallopeptidase [Gemmatimonadaceae bacterium]|nr:M2 family metallopeptidase [Gemmatimonadaceae bacterium]